MPDSPERGDDREADAASARGCPKCGRTEARVEEITTTSPGLSALADVESHVFTVVTCGRCGYCEFYRRSADVVRLFYGEGHPDPDRETASRRSDGSVHYCSMCGTDVEADVGACPGCGRTFV
ncbi:zinc ribbon domain-containing protein [Halomarina pelagica]|uniref:zinc ribbon domain-containing protein n=1 Tax=Halomarina pelagica TaxID=2961599 RepID=UPI0020C38783|nr:zinc ribbon domain-containing protein [Halomarina sp. BND7]